MAGSKHFGEKIIDEVLILRNQGKTMREIAVHFDLTHKQIKGLLDRYKHKKKYPTVLKPKGRPRKIGRTQLEQLEYENKQLKMEVELLKTFLSISEGSDV